MHYLLMLKKYESQLRSLGVHQINGEFSGSCDSGQIDEVCVVDQAGDSLFERLNQIIVDVDEVNNHYQNGEITKVKTTKKMSLYDVCFEIVDAYSMSSGTNWWDNDGGNGYIHILFEDEVTIEANTYYNVMESVNADYQDGTVTELLNELF